MSEPLHTLVIGAGVTGLAAAAEIARRGHTVGLVERHPRPGMETSTHNSGVIHAGLYYPAGSLKALLCVEGARRLYEFCEVHGVPHDRCGKLVVATAEDDVGGLEALYRCACANGVQGLTIVGPDHIVKREPHVSARAALWSPGTGRVDAAALVNALRHDAERHGAMSLWGTNVLGAAARDGMIEVRLERETVLALSVVNAAGLYADDVSVMLGGESFAIYPCRGEYAELKPARRSWINGLVYPLPDPSGHGLGVHLTKTTGGSVLLGPTIRYQRHKDDYESERLPVDAFVEPARRLIPALDRDDLVAGGTGIRAKLQPPEERFADFLIRRDCRQPLLIHAAGIDSPGLTACLAIATRLADLVEATL